MQKRERLNEKILIAIDVLFQSKASFMGIFLMAFMIGVSLRNSPVGYICYCLTSYAFYGIFSVFCAHFFTKHPVAAWRISMFFSIIRILAVILIDPNFVLFPLIIGLLVAIESQLYYRPREFLEVREVTNERRAKYTSARHILIEAAKIVMPFVLGIVISKTSYERTAIIILAISIVQLVLSFFFRPRTKIKTKTHSVREVLEFASGKKEIRRALWLLFACGIALTGCSYEYVSQLNIYNSDSSSINLGGFQSIASIVAIVLLLAYRYLNAKKKTGRDALVYALLPAAILLPVSAILFPGNFVIAIVLFIYFRAVLSTLLCNTIFSVYYQNEYKKSIHDDAYRMEMNILGELWLCMGRVVSLVPLLIIVCLGRNDLMLPLIAVQAILVPVIYFAIRKFSTSRAQDKL